jgi:hypothetical protein
LEGPVPSGSTLLLLLHAAAKLLQVLLAFQAFRMSINVSYFLTICLTPDLWLKALQGNVQVVKRPRCQGSCLLHCTFQLLSCGCLTHYAMMHIKYHRYGYA